jgi:hypothetical protein
MRGSFLLGLGCACVALGLASSAEAQYPPPAPGYGAPGYGAPPPGYGAPGYGAPPPGYGAPGYGAPGYGAPPPGYGAPGYGAPGYGTPGYGAPGYGAPGPKKSTSLEVGFLYVTAAAWGVGTGIWLDAEFGIEDPGLRFILPGVLGVAAPVGVYGLDRALHKMPEGMPSAIATGMMVGAGEGLGIASYQWVHSDEPNEWGFRGLARAEVLGSTLGGLGGYAFYYLARPVPKDNVLVASSIFWGSIIGSEFGAGASNGAWSQTNDSMSLGGLVGFNVALAGAGALATVWTPSWNQLGWMWGGLGLGTALSLPVYIFYAGSDHDARRGLIFQGVAGTLGLAAGALIGTPDKPGAMVENDDHPKFARLLGGGLFPVPGGAGVQAFGQLW